MPLSYFLRTSNRNGERNQGGVIPNCTSLQCAENTSDWAAAKLKSERTAQPCPVIPGGVSLLSCFLITAE